MINIRKGFFETNSSSVHSLTIVPTAMYKRWVNSYNGDEEDFLFMTFTNNDETTKLYSFNDVRELMKNSKYWSDKVDQNWAVYDFAICSLRAFPYNRGDVATAEKDGYTAISWYGEDG